MREAKAVLSLQKLGDHDKEMLIQKTFFFPPNVIVFKREIWEEEEEKINMKKFLELPFLDMY